MSLPSTETPLVSIVVPTHNRIRQLVHLLRALDAQTLSRQLFEVLVVDDGSTDPVEAAVRELDLGYPLTFLHQDNAGPATARNRALERARGLLTLILNDDAVPAANLVQVHLEAHARRSVPTAVLGSFPFVAASLARPFVRLVEETTLLFAYAGMTPGGVYDWTHFWTCNLSLPTGALRAVGGFDEEFREAICEDIELGYRLSKIGVPVLYVPSAICEHDHDIDPERYARRQIALGRNVFLLCEKHPEPEVSRVFGLDRLDGPTAAALARRAEDDRAGVEEDLRRLVAFDRQPLPEDPHACAVRLAEMETLATRVSFQRFRASLAASYFAHHGSVEAPMRAQAVPWSADAGSVVVGDRALTTIVIPCIDGFAHTGPCLDSIAAHTPEPHEVIVVDNGSGAATLAALRARRDIRLLEMGENVGAPSARNRAIELAHGDPVVFLDNDTRVTPGWLSLLAAHTVNNPWVGLVGPMSNHVTGSQKVADPGYDPARLDPYAREFARRHAGRHHYTTRLILFALLVRRRVLDVIGGFDPAFGRWGFEDDDFCLRAAIAGFRLRVAEDVFIHHTGSRTSVAAALDYNEFLRDNWTVFKRKWALDEALRLGAPYPTEKLLRQTFDPARHVVPLGAREAVSRS